MAAGTADLGLGTDTAGSLRVPGSFCGLYAWRPTHGAVPVEGVLPLAQDVDTVGLLARDGATLRRGAAVLLGAETGSSRPEALLRSRFLTGLADPSTALAVEAALAALSVATGLPVREVDVPADAPAAWTAAFRTVQAAQAWANHGAFVEAHPGALSPSVEARFRAGAAVGADELAAAREVVARTRAWLDGLLTRGWLCLPSTSTPAPSREAGPEGFEAARAGTLQLTTLASQCGVPALGLPWGRVGELPVGLCVLAPRGPTRTCSVCWRRWARPDVSRGPRARPGGRWRAAAARPRGGAPGACACSTPWPAGSPVRPAPARGARTAARR